MMPQLTAEQRTAWRNVLIAEVEATAQPSRGHAAAVTGRVRRQQPGRRSTPLLTTAVDAGSSRRRVAGLLRSRWAPLLVAAATAAVVGTVVADGRQAPTDRAPAMLDAAAQVSTADPVPGPGQYLRVRTRAEYMGMDENGNAYLSPEVHEAFVPADPAQPVIKRTTFLPPTTFFGPGGAAFAAKDRALIQPKIQVVRADDPAPAPLPLDPRRLLDALRVTENPAGRPVSEHLFGQLADILQRPGVPAGLRAAAYRALALVPGIVVAENTVVLDGAAGTAFALDHPDGGRSTEIVIDPATGRYIGERLVLSEAYGSLPAGTTLELTAVTTSVVDEAPAPTAVETPPTQLPRR